MPKLNQIVAVVAGKKTRAEKEFGDLNKTIQKSDLFHGHNKQYSPLEDGGEELPSDQKFPQKSIVDTINQSREVLTGIMNAVATQEYGNTAASGDITVDGKTLLTGVPITVLLYLEKQANDLHTFVTNMPTLDPAERWEYNKETGQYETVVTKTIRTKKVQKPIVLYNATDKHPAQTQLITEDITAGHWSTTKYSTAMSATEKHAILNRITRLQDALKFAREGANSLEVEQKTIAGPLLSYIFG